MRLEVAAALGSWRGQWDALVLQQPLPSPFLRSWWLEAAVGHRPRFLLVTEQGTLVGGLALEEDRRLRLPRVLTMGSAMQPDHVDLVAVPGRETEVVGALREWFSRPGSRAVDLWCLPAGSRLADAVPGAEVAEVEGAPWTPLPADFAEYLRSRPAGLPKRVARARKRMGADGVEHRRVPVEELDHALASLRRLHGEVFGETSMFLPYFDRFERAARAGAPAGELVFHELRAGSEVIAIDAVFELAGRISTVQGGRSTDHRWRSAGVALQAAVLEDACDRGIREFDYLRGATEYKRTWAEEVRPLHQLRATSGPLGGATRAMYGAATSPPVVAAVRRAAGLVRRSG